MTYSIHNLRGWVGGKLASLQVGVPCVGVGKGTKDVGYGEGLGRVGEEVRSGGPVTR